MSKLKVASLFEFEKVLRGQSNKLFYSKSEADKVIAELEADYKEACDRLQTARHQKYKRCLAMAMWCETTALWCYQAANTLPVGVHATLHGKPVMIEPNRLFKRFALLTKWSARWFKLAEKFKSKVEEYK